MDRYRRFVDSTQHNECALIGVGDTAGEGHHCGRKISINLVWEVRTSSAVQQLKQVTKFRGVPPGPRHGQNLTRLRFDALP